MRLCSLAGRSGLRARALDDLHHLVLFGEPSRLVLQADSVWEAGPTVSPFGNQVSPQIEASGSAKMGGKTIQFYDCVFFAEHSDRSLQSARLIPP
jgi:hypothetical protein